MMRQFQVVITKKHKYLCMLDPEGKFDYAWGFWRVVKELP